MILILFCEVKLVSIGITTQSINKKKKLNYFSIKNFKIKKEKIFIKKLIYN